MYHHRTKISSCPLSLHLNLPLHLFLAVALFLSPLSLSAEQVSCTIVPDALRHAESVRNLPLKREIPCRVYSKEEVRSYIQNTIKEKLPQAKLKNEEFVYKTLGLIPDEFQYATGLVDLYLSQIGGFYEPEDEFFAMAGWMPSLLQMPIAVHELTHGIQDQYYSLEKFLDMETMSTDELLARSALVEGDATAVMLDYSKKLTGQPMLKDEETVTGVMLQNVLGAGLSPGFLTAPESLKFLLLFPYTSGLRFAHALLKKDGYKEIDRAFKNPPTSTEEILHPEVYFQGGGGLHEVPLLDKEMRSSSSEKRGEIVYTDTLGEFVLALIFRSLGVPHQDASTAANSWNGDRLIVWIDKEGKKSLEWRILLKKDSEDKGISHKVITSYLKKNKKIAIKTLERANGTTLVISDSLTS